MNREFEADYVRKSRVIRIELASLELTEGR